jgi:hypothetical protein
MHKCYQLKGKNQVTTPAEQCVVTLRSGMKPKSVLLIQIGNDCTQEAARFAACDAAMIERQRQG